MNYLKKSWAWVNTVWHSYRIQKKQSDNQHGTWIHFVEVSAELSFLVLLLFSDFFFFNLETLSPYLLGPNSSTLPWHSLKKSNFLEAVRQYLKSNFTFTVYIYSSQFFWKLKYRKQDRSHWLSLARSWHRGAQKADVGVSSFLIWMSCLSPNCWIMLSFELLLLLLLPAWPIA